MGEERGQYWLTSEMHSLWEQDHLGKVLCPFQHVRTAVMHTYVGICIRVVSITSDGIYYVFSSNTVLYAVACKTYLCILFMLLNIFLTRRIFFLGHSEKSLEGKNSNNLGWSGSVDCAVILSQEDYHEVKAILGYIVRYHLGARALADKCMHKDLSWVPEPTLLKSWVWWYTVAILMLKKQRQAGLLARHPSLFGRHQARDSVWKVKWTTPKKKWHPKLTSDL